MKNRIVRSVLFLMMCLTGGIWIVQSQSNLVGTISVERGSIEIKRVDTEAWVTLTRESIVGSGDSMRTLADSQATLAFLASQVSITLKPETEIVIDQLQQQDNVVLVTLKQNNGEAIHSVSPTSSLPITLEVSTLNLGAFTQNGKFTIQANADNSYVLNETGDVIVRAGGSVQTLAPATGVRMGEKGLSAPLPATTVSALTSAIDGITATLATEIDGVLNVRKSPSIDSEVLGQVDVSQVTRVLGVSSNQQWYRIPYKSGAGWISAAGLIVETEVSRLLVFEMDYVEVDASAVAIATPAPVAEAPASVASSYSVLNDYSLSEVTMLAQLNDWRASVGLAPFRLSPVLSQMAEDQARYVLSFPSLPSDIHRDADGTYPMERALNKKYNWPFYAIAARMAVGENTYAGATEAVAVKWWQGSTTHKNTVENAGYREIGITSLPHTYGKIFVIVFGARPDILPALIDPTTQTMYLTTEQYKFSDGGNWLKQVQEYQILNSPLSQIDEGAWKPFAAKVPAPTQGKFTLALRGNGKVVMTEVDAGDSVAWFTSNLSLLSAPSGGGASPFATSTPRP